ncbi:hypothetical protein VTO73DRAFT_4335 [Trametes versicolor]
MARSISATVTDQSCGLGMTSTSTYASSIIVISDPSPAHCGRSRASWKPGLRRPLPYSKTLIGCVQRDASLTFRYRPRFSCSPRRSGACHRNITSKGTKLGILASAQDQ